MLTDDEYVLVKRMYNMADDMINSLTKMIGLTTTSDNPPIKDESLKHELIKHALYLEYIRIRFSKILNGTAGY